MIEACRMLGIAPLSREEFDSENKRMYVDLVRRRRGDFNGTNFSIFT